VKAKLAWLLTSILLVLLAVSTAPKSAEASCSGDDCGCYIDAQACQADCLLLPPSQQLACGNGCVHDSLLCAKACCGNF
jgi:hypothetical protein